MGLRDLIPLYLKLPVTTEEGILAMPGCNACHCRDFCADHTKPIPALDAAMGALSDVFTRLSGCPPLLSAMHHALRNTASSLHRVVVRGGSAVAKSSDGCIICMCDICMPRTAPDAPGLLPLGAGFASAWRRDH